MVAQFITCYYSIYHKMLIILHLNISQVIIKLPLISGATVVMLSLKQWLYLIVSFYIAFPSFITYNVIV